jgi:hypothetical protein
MTTSSHTATQLSSFDRYVGVGVAASVVHMLLMIPGYSDTSDLRVTAYAVVFAISLAVTVLLIGTAHAQG